MSNTAIYNSLPPYVPPSLKLYSCLKVAYMRQFAFCLHFLEDHAIASNKTALHVVYNDKAIFCNRNTLELQVLGQSQRLPTMQICNGTLGYEMLCSSGEGPMKPKKFTGPNFKICQLRCQLRLQCMNMWEVSSGLSKGTISEEASSPELPDHCVNMLAKTTE